MDGKAADGRPREPQPVYLLYGEEEHLRDSAAQELVSRILDPDSRDFNYTVFRAGGSDAGEIAAALMSPPLLSDRRVVLVRGFDEFAPEDQAALARAIPAMPRTTVAILVARAMDERGEAYRLVSGIGRVVRYRRMYPSDAADWLTRHARSHGVELDPAAREYLVRVVGTSAASLAEALERVRDFVGVRDGEHGRLSLADVKQVVSGQPDLSVFDLVEAIGQRDATRAIDAARRIASFGEVPVRVLAMIARQIRLILQAKALQEQGMGVQQIAGAMRVQDYAARKYLAQARNFSHADLERAFEEMVETDVRLKAAGAPDQILLESLILRLCAPDARGRANRGG